MKLSNPLPLILILILMAAASSDVSGSKSGKGSARLADGEDQGVCEPHHIHLSVGRLQNQTHSSMTVSFSISSACVGRKRHKDKSFGAVRLIGGEGGEDDFLVIGDSNSTKEYDAMSPRKGVERYYSDLYYHIEINDLRPDREYSYECLLVKKDAVSSMQYYLREDRTTLIIDNDDDNVIARSGISSFTTPPAPGQWRSSGRTVKFAVIGDLAAKEHSKKTIRHLDFHSESVDAILFAGDLAYPGKDHVTWDRW